MNSWNAFRTGLSRATRYRWVLLILFAVNLLTALLLAVFPALSLLGPGHRTAIRQAADGVDAWMVVETMMSPLTYAVLEGSAEPIPPPGLQQGILLALLTAALLPLLSWLPASFLTGGLLLTYTEAPQILHWRRFLWGCWHWWGAFLLLGAVQGIVSFLLFAPLIAIAMGTVAVAGGWLTWVVIPLLGLVAVLWVALMECTRVAAVVGETRNVARAFGEAVRFFFRHPLPVAGLYGLALLLLVLLHALYRCVMLYLPLDWWPLVLIVQQAFILARLWTRLARLAGGTVLYRGLGDW